MEILVEVPGEWDIDKEKSFDTEGNFSPVFIYNDEPYKWQKIIQYEMERAEEYYFKLMSSRTDLKGKTSAELAPFWKH